MASSSDVDDDPVGLSYAWEVDAAPQTETSNVLAGPFLVGSLVSCTATPNDGKEDGASEVASVTVSNTEPVVDTPTLDPGVVQTEDVITASATGSDVDVEQTVTLSYEWHVVDAATGSDTTVQTGPDNTLSGVTHFDRDDQVYVVVTPNDGVSNGTPVASASLEAGT